MSYKKRILSKTKETADKIFGTIVDELYWKFRHIRDKDWPKSYISSQSITHGHRIFLAGKIEKYLPLESVLEIGCSSGPNLYILANKFRKTKFYGTDISGNAIKVGKDFFNKNNLPNVVLNKGKAEDLSAFKDKSIDMIFTDAVLIYLGPDKINSVIKEMLRVARKAIVMCEQNTNDSRGSIYNNHWLHNYGLLFSQFPSVKEIKKTKLPPSIWSGQWADSGYIIEVLL